MAAAGLCQVEVTVPIDEEGEITRLLRRSSSGDEQAKTELIPLVYAELHRIAARRFSLERPGHTLQPTALINELYLRLIADGDIDWQSRQHFYAVSTTTLRRILVDHAKAANAKRRPPRGQQVSLEDVIAFVEDHPEDLLCVHEALDDLASRDLQAAHVFELRWFGGFTVEETAKILVISDRTVKRDYAAAYAWLTRELGKSYGQHEV